MCSILQLLLELRAKHPGYRIKLLGHSLGAGTAALLGLYLRNDSKEFKDAGVDPEEIYCTVFAPPACTSENLAKKFTFCTSLVMGVSDIVGA